MAARSICNDAEFFSTVIEMIFNESSDLIFIYEPINGSWRGITTQFEK